MPGISAATCQAETCCAFRADSCNCESCWSTRLFSEVVKSTAFWRRGSMRKIAAASTSSSARSADKASTIERASICKACVSSLVVVSSSLAVICRSSSSKVRRSCRSNDKLSSLRSTWYWRAVRSSEFSCSLTRRSCSAAATPAETSASLCSATRSILTSAQMTAIRRGRATRPKPRSIKPFSDLGRGNFMVPCGGLQSGADCHAAQ